VNTVQTERNNMKLIIEGTRAEIVAAIRDLGEAPEVLLTNADKLKFPWLIAKDGSDKGDKTPTAEETLSPEERIALSKSTDVVHWPPAAPEKETNADDKGV
jgi:hypothetical protein